MFVGQYRIPIRIAMYERIFELNKSINGNREFKVFINETGKEMIPVIKGYPIKYVTVLGNSPVRI